MFSPLDSAGASGSSAKFLLSQHCDIARGSAHRWQSKSHSNEERRDGSRRKGFQKRDDPVPHTRGDAPRVIILGRAIPVAGDDNNNLNRGHLAYVQFGA